MKALENITINQKYGLVLKKDIDKQNELIKRLKEQIKEANEVIKDYDGYEAELSTDGKYIRKVANNAHLYLERWGVK